MTDAEPDRAMVIYQSFMTEVKIRLAAINEMLKDFDKVAQSPHNFIVAESCYLQLRMVCELIALAAVVIHEPQGLTNKILADYNPTRVFKLLHKLNDRCFPEAIIVNSLAVGRHHISFPDDKPFTAFSLEKCYNACGDALHRGVAKSLLEGKVKNYDLVYVRLWLTGIAMLLENHMILLNQNEAITVHMSGGEGGAVLITRGVASDDPFEA